MWCLNALIIIELEFLDFYTFFQKSWKDIPTSQTFQKSFSSAFNNTVEFFKQNLILFLKISQKIFALVKSKEKAAIAAWRSRFDSGLMNNYVDL